MTPEEIKKIAEEYADSFGRDSDYRNDPCYGGHIDEAEDVLEFLTERFYLVEKGKVEQEMINANQNIDLFNPYPKVKYANEGVKRVLTKLFGPDIRKEEEDA